MKYISKKTNTSFTIHETVEYINKDAFFNASNLEKINLSKTRYIGYYAFKNCKNISSLIVPETVYDIDPQAFAYSGIKEVKINVKDFEAGDHGLSDSESYEGAFKNCKELRNVYLRNGISAIPFHMFNGCTSLQTITIPNSVRLIGSDAFNDCTSLKSVKLSTNLNRIYYSTFANCKSLESIILPKKIKYINYGAFENCTSLKSITIPASVIRIGKIIFLSNSPGAFQGCYNLTKFVFKGKKTKIDDKSIGYKSGSKRGKVPMHRKNKITIYAPKGSYAEQYAKKFKIKFKQLESWKFLPEMA